MLIAPKPVNMALSLLMTTINRAKMPRLRTAPLLFLIHCLRHPQPTPPNTMLQTPHTTHPSPHPPAFLQLYFRKKQTPPSLHLFRRYEHSPDNFHLVNPTIVHLPPHRPNKPSPYPRNVHSNRIVLSSPTRQQNSSILPSDDAKQDPWWGSGLAPSSFHPSTTPQLPSSDRPPRPPKYPQPPRQLTLRQSSMEREEEAFDESHNEPTISEATKERKTNKNSERFGLQKMIEQRKKEKSQQQLDNPIAQPRAESGKKDKEATSIQVGKEDGLEEGETVEEEGETGNFQNRTEEEENTNHSPSQPNSSFESSQSPPSSPIQLKRTLRQRDPVTKQAITGNRLKSNFSHPLNSTSSQTPKERQKQSPKLPNRRRPPKRVGKSPVPIHQPPLTPISPLPLVYDSDIANQFLMSLKSETGRERQKQKRRKGRKKPQLDSESNDTSDSENQSLGSIRSRKRDCPTPASSSSQEESTTSASNQTLSQQPNSTNYQSNDNTSAKTGTVVITTQKVTEGGTETEEQKKIEKRQRQVEQLKNHILRRVKATPIAESSTQTEATNPQQLKKTGNVQMTMDSFFEVQKRTSPPLEQTEPPLPPHIVNQLYQPTFITNNIDFTNSFNSTTNIFTVSQPTMNMFFETEEEGMAKDEWEIEWLGGDIDSNGIQEDEQAKQYQYENDFIRKRDIALNWEWQHGNSPEMGFTTEHFGKTENETEMSGKRECGTDTMVKVESGLDMIGKVESESVAIRKVESRTDSIGTVESGSEMMKKVESESDTTGKVESGSVTRGKVENGTRSIERMEGERDKLTSVKMNLNEPIKRKENRTTPLTFQGQSETKIQADTDDWLSKLERAAAEDTLPITQARKDKHPQQKGVEKNLDSSFQEQLEELVNRRKEVENMWMSRKLSVKQVEDRKGLMTVNRTEIAGNVKSGEEANQREDEKLLSWVKMLIETMKIWNSINFKKLMGNLELKEGQTFWRTKRWGEDKVMKVESLATATIRKLLPILGIAPNTSLPNYILHLPLNELSREHIELINTHTTTSTEYTFVIAKAWNRIKAPEKKIGQPDTASPNTVQIPIPTFKQPQEASHLRPADLPPFNPTNGYTSWSEDLTTQHLHGGRTLLAHLLSKANDRLADTNWSREEIDELMWKLSSIPSELKARTHKPKRKTVERTVRLSQEETLNRAVKKWENLVARGKTSSITKEIEDMNAGRTQSLSFDEVKQRITALHNDEDRKALYLSVNRRTREQVRSGEKLEIRNATNGLNSNSTPSLDGLTAENSFEQETLILSRGEETAAIPNSRGVQQGCPLSPSLFAFYITEPMRQAEAGGATAWGYLDDLVLMANSEAQLNRSLTKLSTSLTAHGLTLNPTKTVIMSVVDGVPSTKPINVLGHSVTPRTSAKLLGTIVTNDQQTRDNFFMERVERIKSTLPKVSLLSHQAHLHLLRQSISSKPLHILATTFISEEALISADTTITSHLSNLFNIPDSQQFLIHLPIKEGGLGIPSFVQTALPSLICSHASLHPEMWEADHIQRAKVDLESRDTQPSFSTSKPVMRMITHLTKEEYDAARQGQKQLRELMTKEETAAKLSLLSVHQQNKHNVIKSAENQKWRSTLPVDRYHKINNNVFSVKCWKTTPAAASEPAVRLARHHAIKFLLAQTLKEIPSITVRTETKMGRDDEDANEEANTIADLQLRVTTGYTKHRFVRDILGIKDDGQRILEFGLDLVIPQDFTSRSHTQRGMMDPKGRVKEAERKKERKYSRAGQSHTVIGIGLSDHGHSGPNASLFFDFIKQLAIERKIPNPLPIFFTQVSVIMELVRSHMEQTYIKTLSHLAREEEERKRTVGIRTWNHSTSSLQSPETHSTTLQSHSSTTLHTTHFTRQTPHITFKITPPSTHHLTIPHFTSHTGAPNTPRPSTPLTATPNLRLTQTKLRLGKEEDEGKQDEDDAYCKEEKGQKEGKKEGHDQEKPKEGTTEDRDKEEAEEVAQRERNNRVPGLGTGPPAGVPLYPQTHFFSLLPSPQALRAERIERSTKSTIIKRPPDNRKHKSE
ncbi:putative Reverse transcriptase (RNA-dependent DNA polymerase) [Blattamonas nauphoetae]|uniref:Reverse transcriptase (RNA-dependent DNA polymerase) n=1 Tax=Blattamonas nauphoetae TaxID=2049346 RepID=A0ABQ9WUJ4_9EUKA|nr:putative Reverse transcriptase (RNA-dependent DNA polymerase) [Blattamonas nauphoetae]